MKNQPYLGLDCWKFHSIQQPRVVAEMHFPSFSLRKMQNAQRCSSTWSFLQEPGTIGGFTMHLQGNLRPGHWPHANLFLAENRQWRHRGGWWLREGTVGFHKCSARYLLHHRLLSISVGFKAQIILLIPPQLFIQEGKAETTRGKHKAYTLVLQYT